jgi:Ca2+-binding EF-hand superfamily protein
MNKNSRRSSSDEAQLQKDLQTCFDKFDSNHDGYLDQQELVELVRVVYTHTGHQGRQEQFYREAALDLLRKADYHAQGKVTLSDFYRFYKDY